MPSESILYIVPDLIGLPNGIGRYCQLVCQALVGHPNCAPLGWALARAAGARLSVFGYGDDIWYPLSRARQWALQRADQLIVISQFTARQGAAANGYSLERARILYNCLPPQF